VLEAVGVHARREEAVRWLGKAVPGVAELAEIQNRGGGSATRRGGRVRRQRGEEWGQEELRRLRGAQIGGADGRWAGKPAAAAVCGSSKAGGGRRLGGLVCNF
jgi:hypothetical protein